MLRYIVFIVGAAYAGCKEQLVVRYFMLSIGSQDRHKTTFYILQNLYFFIS